MLSEKLLKAASNMMNGRLATFKNKLEKTCKGKLHGAQIAISGKELFFK